MRMHGLNVDPLNPAGRPDPTLLHNIGFEWVRMVARPGITDYHDACQRAGLRTLLVIARESVLAASIGYYARTYFPDAWQIGNEPDAVSPSSWTMAQEGYVAFWRECVSALKPQAAPIVTAGLASGHPEWIGPIAGELWGCHAVAVHPYAKTADQARALIQEYRRVTGLAVWVSEWNRPAGEIAGFVRMLCQETEVSCWFAATNGMENGFGLLDVPEKLAAMKEALMNVNIPELDGLQQRIELLEKQQAYTVDVLKLIIQGRWTGEMPHAEALLKALNPSDTDWQAVPFPRS